MKLHEFPWWPRKWSTTNHRDVPPEQISQDGIFEACTVTAHGLMIEVDYCGSTVVGRVPQPSVNSPGNMFGLRNFLLEHTGSSMATIENLDVEADQFNITTT
jgi:hypothetical protein